MTLIPARHSRFGRFRRGLLGGAGRGGPSRLVGIASVVGLAAGGAIFFSMHNERHESVSRVAPMPRGNLLPGGLLSTPAQDALLKTDSDDKAHKAEEARKSFTPPMPGSVAFTGHFPSETGMGLPDGFAPVDTKVARQPRPPAVVPVPRPAYTPPQPLAPPEIHGARVERVGDDGPAPEARAQGGYEQRQKAIGAMLDAWNSRPPRTTVVIQPAVLKEELGADPPARAKGVSAASGQVQERVLVPAGRGIYAHTVLAVDSDTNGSIVLEADTGPIAGDRMIGTFSKSGLNRLIVRVQTVEHRGKALEANGIVIAPDSMEEAVATSIDQHYFERFVLPAAAAFMEGLGSAVAMSNSTVTVSPFGGTTQTFGPMSLKQQAMIGGGAGAQAIGNAMSASIPSGPTVHLAANVSVGVMFLSNLSIK